MEKKPYGMQRNTPLSGVRKNRPIKNSLFLIAALLLISLTSLHADDVANLRCEYLENPLGIDVANSRLSWVIEERDQKPEAGGRKQTAYQVLVASTPELLAKDQGEQLQDFALITGRAAEAKRCGERLAALRPLVHKTFFQEAKGTYLYSSQSSLAMALYARIPPPELRSKIMAQLENMIVVEKQGHLDTGLLGTFVMLDLLIQENRNWRREGDKLTMEVTIPANTTATVHIPAQDEAGVTESGKPAAKSDGVKFLRLENGVAVYELGSGTYSFQSMFIKAP
jgi:hypothetical protein